MKILPYLIITLLTVLGINITFSYEQLQGFHYNIIYLHVPMSWITLSLYLVLVMSSVMYLIYKNPKYNIIHNSVLNVTIITCFLSIITGSLWAKPTWNTYMTLDIRIMSMILLLVTLIVIKYIKLGQHIVTIIASINLVIIKYVVKWYNSIHQQASISLVESKIHISIVMPMIIVWIGLIYITILCVIIDYKINKYKKWV